MAEVKYNGKVVYYGEVLMDLTGDSVTPEKVEEGVTFHGPDGAPKTGTSKKDVDTSGATATEAEVLTGKTFGARGQMRTGTMPNNGAVKGEITDKDTPYTIKPGYHDGSGTVGLSAADKEKLVGGNIRDGVTVLGVLGTMTGDEAVKAETKVVTPTKDGSVVTPDTLSGYTHLAQVTINAIPYKETPNAAGGYTVTIGE